MLLLVLVGSLVGNAGNMSANMSSHHRLLPCFGREPTYHCHQDWESILVSHRPISQHNICKTSPNLARQDICLLMSSWASHDIGHVTNMSCEALLTCLYVDS